MHHQQIYSQIQRGAQGEDLGKKKKSVPLAEKKTRGRGVKRMDRNNFRILNCLNLVEGVNFFSLT